MRKDTRIKEVLLSVLKDSKNNYFSGEEISKQLNVSRTAVWKHINELKKQGYVIDSVTNKGYALRSTVDVLSTAAISSGLSTRILGRNIEVHKSIDSTNNRAKILAAQGCEDGTLVIAEEQTAGRGRLGRQWSSAAGKGLWMSLIMKKPMAPDLTGLITLGISLAVVEALTKNLGNGFGIKWPNDIVADGRKLCGILCEMSAEQDAINHVVAGIGMNLSHSIEDFQEELTDMATSLKLFMTNNGLTEKPGLLERSFWASEILNELEKLYFVLLEQNGCGIIDKWKKYSLTLGKEVKVIYKDETLEGRAVDVNSNGELLVEDLDGNIRTIRSGEAKVRGIMGYV